MDLKGQTVVTVNERPTKLQGWRKITRQCTACDGAGSKPDQSATYGIRRCPGCHGWGFVREWRKGK